jgi:hypothetical protein
MNTLAGKQPMDEDFDMLESDPEEEVEVIKTNTLR